MAIFFQVELKASRTPSCSPRSSKIFQLPCSYKLWKLREMPHKCSQDSTLSLPPNTQNRIIRFPIVKGLFLWNLSLVRRKHALWPLGGCLVAYYRKPENFWFARDSFENQPCFKDFSVRTTYFPRVTAPRIHAFAVFESRVLRTAELQWVVGAQLHHRIEIFFVNRCSNKQTILRQIHVEQFSLRSYGALVGDLAKLACSHSKRFFMWAFAVRFWNLNSIRVDCTEPAFSYARSGRAGCSIAAAKKRDLR